MSFDFQSELYQRRQNTFDGAGNLIGCRFDADNGKVSQMNHARHYVQHWQKMREKGIGLLFWGPPGTGKTYAAACIANAFVESKEDFAPSVIMTTFGCILRRMLACGPQEREEYFDRLLRCHILILDDFGMERQTDYAREQIFHIIDGRYLSCRPLIVTTNLSLQELKHPKDLAQARICDRILELCVPVCFDGESLRQDRAKERMRLYKEITAS